MPLEPTRLQVSRCPVCRAVITLSDGANPDPINTEQQAEHFQKHMDWHQELGK